MVKNLLAVFIAIFILALVPTNVAAKRKLPQAATTTVTKSISQPSSRNVITSVKFRSDKKAIIVTFSNLSVMQSISYTLSYDTNGVKQGASGTITSAVPDPTTRELLFGTCSANVCTYDTNITTAKLTITTTLKSGKKIVKPYKLKV